MKKHNLKSFLLSVITVGYSLLSSAQSKEVYDYFKPSETGEIMMIYVQGNHMDDYHSQYRTVWAWSTKTGKSARFYYDFDTTKWIMSEVALPDNPLGDSPKEPGEIMMNYVQGNHMDDYNSQYRTVWVWNTKTGKSARFYYDFDTTKWIKSDVTLP